MDVCTVESDYRADGLPELRITGPAGPEAALQLRTVALECLARGKRRIVIRLDGAESMHAAVMQVLIAVAREVELIPAGNTPAHLVEPLGWCGLERLAGEASA